MSFLKKNIHDILKLYINQIGIGIFYLAIIFPLNTISGEDGLPRHWDFIVSLFSILFYFVLIYYAVWDIGAKDKIRFDSGRYEATPYKGIALALFANIPNLLFSLPLVIFAAIGFFTPVINKAFGIFNILTRFHEVFYNGLLSSLFGDAMNLASPAVQFLISTLLLLLPLLLLPVAQFAYYMGSHERRILAFIPQKPPKR